MLFSDPAFWSFVAAIVLFAVSVVGDKFKHTKHGLVFKFVGGYGSFIAIVVTIIVLFFQLI